MSSDHVSVTGFCLKRNTVCIYSRRLLQWAPLKCYDAAGIRRGVFLAGTKSEQLLKALYASMKDTSFSLDEIEGSLSDNE
jgi:hypothetical protein